MLKAFFARIGFQSSVETPPLVGMAGQAGTATALFHPSERQKRERRRKSEVQFSACSSIVFSLLFLCLLASSFRQRFSCSWNISSRYHHRYDEILLHGPRDQMRQILCVWNRLLFLYLYFSKRQTSYFSTKQQLLLRHFSLSLNPLCLSPQGMHFRTAAFTQTGEKVQQQQQHFGEYMETAAAAHTQNGGSR